MINSNTIEIVKTNECTGCTSCVNACPVNAITMLENREGFLFPTINHELCIDCGICKKKCPALINTKKNLQPECYAMWAQDDIRMKSSSGGIFTVLAEKILQNGGYVCGASWDENWTVKHSIINDSKELDTLRGSKYLQSNLGNTYSEIKTLLERNEQVLFSGCPCQVSGLNAFLDKEYSNLLTVDILCHGVPSPKAFNKFLKTVVKLDPTFKQDSYNLIENIKKIDFRNKEKFGWAPSMYIKFKSNAEYSKKRSETSWYSSFLNILNCRESCGNCKYASLPREGDITLGDFWGISDYKSELNDGKGTSLVLLNNTKAKNIINSCDSQLKLKEIVDVKIAQRKNWNIVGSSKTHKNRKRFFELLDLYDDYGKIVDFSLNRKFDFGFVGWWYGKNYGSVLTNFALHQFIKNLGYSVLMLEWPLKNDITVKDENSMARKIANEYYEVSKRRTYDQMNEVNKYCDAFILGSDQLWNYWSIKETGYYYFLDFVDDSKKKIAYATSFGHPTFGGPNSYLKNAAFHMNRFDNISVREVDGIDICNTVFGVKATQVIDPVFLCDYSEYTTLIRKSTNEIPQPYIFAYILSPSLEKRNELLELKKKTGLDIILVIDAQKNYTENAKIMDMDDSLKGNLNIEDWLKYICNSSYVVTDSYHGACFSIIFKKNFVCVANLKRGISRFKTLFGLLGLNERLIYDETLIPTFLEKQIDYESIYDKLDIEIERSKEWLVNSIRTNKPVKASTYDLLNQRILELEKIINEIIRNH